MSLFDHQRIGIPCDCGRETKKSIAWLKSHKQFTCLCGTVIHLKADHLLGVVRDVERGFARLGRF